MRDSSSMVAWKERESPSLMLLKWMPIKMSFLLIMNISAILDYIGIILPHPMLAIKRITVAALTLAATGMAKEVQ